MMTTTATTPRLSEAARHLVIPDGITTSVFPRVERKLRSVGIEFDPWQIGFGTVALGCRENGLYAATVGGVVASIPRQVGKTFTVGNLLIGMAVLFPKLRIIWTSHHARTTTNTFRSMQAMVGRGKIQSHLAVNGIRTANGEQEIRFANGSIIMFGAREQGFGRGMDAIDIEVFDEAQILSIKALEDMVPATNQARHPHGGLIFFIGTPPRPSDDGQAFATKRARAVSGQTTDQVYVEFSADPKAGLDDRAQWRLMNPSYPTRTTTEAMLRMRENIPDDDSWRREAMGIWPPDVLNTAVISTAIWGPMVNVRADLTGPIALAVDRAPNGVDWAIAAAQRTTHDRIHLEVGFFQPGTHDAVVTYLAAIVAAWDPVALVIDRKSGAAVLEAKLIAAEIEPTMTNAPQMAVACQGFYDDAVAALLSHVGDEVLDDALASAEKRTMPQGDWAWNRNGDAVISPLVAATLARWALVEFGAETTGPAAAPAYGDNDHPHDSSDLDVFETAF